MDTAYSDGGRVQKYSSVHGGAEELWWIKQGLANLGAETTASPYQAMQTGEPEGSGKNGQNKSVNEHFVKAGIFR